MWAVSFTVNRDNVKAFASALDDVAVAVSQFEESRIGQNVWRIDALFEREPNQSEVKTWFSKATAFCQSPVPPMIIAPVPDTDWLAETLTSFSPIQVGRFWVHGRHHTGSMPPGMVPVQVEATTAFGTGEHATTQACLLAIDALANYSPFVRLLRSTRSPPVLDIGCGTGVLAIAAAKHWRCSVLASDIDLEAVQVTHQMVRNNGLHESINVVRSAGVRHRTILHSGPYALITANILAQPLCDIAMPVARLLMTGGRLVLSGLLKQQVSFVLSAYRQQRLHLERTIFRGPWATLVLKR